MKNSDDEGDDLGTLAKLILVLIVVIALIILFIGTESSAQVPVVIIERDLAGNELASEVATLHYLQSAGADGIIFEFTGSTIFKDGFDG
jgi:hypothetical protein